LGHLVLPKYLRLLKKISSRSNKTRSPRGVSAYMVEIISILVSYEIGLCLFVGIRWYLNGRGGNLSPPPYNSYSNSPCSLSTLTLFLSASLFFSTWPICFASTLKLAAISTILFRYFSGTYISILCPMLNT